jgi:NADH:ubiquinone oxidoreductase subunit 3 (subunit A)
VAKVRCFEQETEYWRRIMENYFPILMFVLVGVAIGVLPVAMGFILAPSRPDPEKLSPYECGFEAFEDARMKFDVRYYLIAILFILFDLEIAFLFRGRPSSKISSRRNRSRCSVLSK